MNNVYVFRSQTMLLFNNYALTRFTIDNPLVFNVFNGKIMNILHRLRLRIAWVKIWPN